MLRLPNNHKLTLIKRETGLFENVVMREFPPTGKLGSGGGGAPAFLLASSHPEEGRNEQVSVLFVYFTIFFFFLKLGILFVSIWLSWWCKNTVENCLKTSRELLVAGVSCKRSPIALGNRGLRQSHFSFESKFYFVSLGTRCSYLLTSNKTASETVCFCI